LIVFKYVLGADWKFGYKESLEYGVKKQIYKNLIVLF